MPNHTLPTIAIVVPAKNEARYLRSCLDSLRLLQYPKELLEIVLVDNESIDQTLEIAKEFSEVKTISKSGNIGAVRNAGARMSKSDLIAFVDADCVPPPQWLSSSVSHIQNGASVVSAMISDAGEQSPWIEKCWIEYLQSKYAFEISEVRTISSFCFLVRRDTMERVGWFNEELKTCEDSDLGYRISHLGDKLLVVKSIPTIHLGNAKTTTEFFMRQVWSGSSNLKNLFSHKLDLSELPSILAPLFYILGCFLLPILLVVGQVSLALLCVLVVIGAPISLALVKRKNGKPHSFTQFSIIWFLYLSARGVALLQSFRAPRRWR